MTSSQAHRTPAEAPPRRPRSRGGPAAEEFEGVYRRHYPAVQRYLRRRVGDAHAVEDLAAETFLVAYRHYARWEDRGLPIRAWLYRLATSRLHRWLRRGGRRRTQALEAEPYAAEPEDGARRESARRALLALPARLQSALALHYLEGLSVEAVAGVLGCRPGTVKSRLHRGRRALRRELERRGFEA